MVRLKKIVAFLLSVVLLLQYMPTHTVNATTVNEAENSQVSRVAQDTIYDGVYIEDVELKGHTKRLKEKEDLNTYVFENADGTNTLYMMDENVKYKTASGKVKDKNINLKKIYGGYSVSDNEYSLQIPNGIKEGISFGYKDSQIRLIPQDIDSSDVIKNVELKNNAVTYKNIYGEGIDLRYTPLLDGVKEDIILGEYTQKNSFEFILYSDGKDIYNDNGRYYLADTADATDKIYLGNVIMYDAVGRPEEGELEVEAIKRTESYKITIKVSDEYLSDDLTVYPVTIDPTIKVEPIYDSSRTGGAIEDCPVYSGRKDSNHGTYYFNRVSCYNDSYGTGRTAMKFKLDGLVTSSGFTYDSLKINDIISAKLYLKEGSGTASRNIEMYALPSNISWTETTLTWGDLASVALTENNRITTSAMASNATCVFDITSYIQMCKKGTCSLSNGVLLKDEIEDKDNPINKSFVSAEYTTSGYRPYIQIQYYENSVNAERDSGTYFIRNVSSKKCFALVPDDESGDDALGQLDYSKNEGAIRWSLVTADNDYYYIKRGSNTYLSVSLTGSDVELDWSSTVPEDSRYLWKLKNTAAGNLRIVSKYNESEEKVLMINSNNICCADYSEDTTYTDEWRIDAYIPVSGAPINDGYVWNDSGAANCYMYAFNMKENPIDSGNGFIHPGEISERTFKHKDISVALISEYTLLDSEEKFTFRNIGKFESCAIGEYKVALVIDPGKDYHWYRQNVDGTWSHKPGSNNAIIKDSSEIAILDPEYANRHNGFGNNYYIFGGFYAVTPFTISEEDLQ